MSLVASKKRPAKSQGGPAPKKAHVASKGAPKKNAKGSSSLQKRSRPVTAPVADSGTEEEEEDDEDDEEETAGEVRDLDGPRIKAPNASRESHRAQKEIQSQRKLAKPNSELLINAKKLWSLARKKDIPKEERQKHIEALMAVVRGKVQDVVFKHDASRIIQTLVKYGGQKEKDEVADELKGKYKELAQNKYAKFLVTKLIRYCSSHRFAILAEFHGHILRLLLHRESSRILADAFELYANSVERNLLVRDLYGKEIALFRDGADGKVGLKGILEGADAERRKRVVSALKDNLISIFNNPDKGAVSHAIVHRALWEYLTEINGIADEAERDRARREIFDSCQELVAEMVHTRDGSRVVREFLAQGSAKERKQIIKVLKPHLERMCKDEEAQLVLFTAFDVVDDTKLLAKSLVTDVVSHASTLYSEINGRRSLLYLIVPRSPKHFTPAIISVIEETDPIRAKTSKKEDAIRRAEIRQAASESLLALVKEKGAELSQDTGGSLFLTEVMLSTEGDKTPAMEALLQPLKEPYPSPEHPIEGSHTSRVYKTLLQGGHYSQATKSVTPSPLFSASAFATAFLNTVGRENVVNMAKGSGTFVIAELVERVTKEGSNEDKQKIKTWFGKEVQKQIMASKPRGADVLLEKLKAL